MASWEMLMTGLWGGATAQVVYVAGTTIYTNVKAAECSTVWTNLENDIKGIPVIGSVFGAGDNLANVVILALDPIPGLLGFVVAPLTSYVLDSEVLGVLSAALLGLGYGVLYTVPKALEKCK